MKDVRIVSVDQSCSCTAITYWEDGVAVGKEFIKTGSTHSKGKRKDDVVYVDNICDQLNYIAMELFSKTMEFKADYFVLEAPAQGGFGSAVAALKTLYRQIEEVFLNGGFNMKNFDNITPTAIKAYARVFLPDEMQYSGQTKAGIPKKCKMDKKEMLLAAKTLVGEDWFSDVKISNGAYDAADSYLIGHMFINRRLNVK